MTEFVFREDAYAREAAGRVQSVTPEGGVMLDRTVFYASSGGQPGDTGRLRGADGTLYPVNGTIHPQGDKSAIVHLLEGDRRPAPGEAVDMALDWPRRHRLMRMHTALHLLSVVLPFPVSGGAIGAEKSRLDFDMPEVPDDLAAREAQLNALIADDHPVSAEWISEEALAADPGLVKTMAVQPPRGQGRIRLIRIGAGPDPVDLQPCGGTHVASSAEIGAVRFGKVEKKGRQNRRVNLHFEQ